MYDEKLPLTLKRTKPYSNNHKPWVNSAILTSIHHKHAPYKKVYKIKSLNPTRNINDIKIC